MRLTLAFLLLAASIFAQTPTQRPYVPNKACVAEAYRASPLANDAYNPLSPDWSAADLWYRAYFTCEAKAKRAKRKPKAVDAK